MPGGIGEGLTEVRTRGGVLKDEWGFLGRHREGIRDAGDKGVQAARSWPTLDSKRPNMVVL